MKQSIILLTVLILVVSFSSCRKDESQEGFQHVASSEEMIVQEGFTFNTTTEVSFTVHTNTISQLLPGVSFCFPGLPMVLARWLELLKCRRV